uniref:IPPc domain-containing protein n=1 Tax=Angiostrongylus cantonensis TaxID=6313 RepID=A0A0K0CXM2_ANGCA
MSFQNRTAIVFVDSHFVHDVFAYDRRIAQFHSNKVCCFPEDPEVKAVFWLGDLNFRVEKEPEEVMELIKSNAVLGLLSTDEQLKRAVRKGEAFVGFEEPAISFPPTYRFYVGTTEYDLKRTPSWCDRVLYKGDIISPVSYSCNQEVLVSDHLPVQAVFNVKISHPSNLTWDCLFEHLPTWYTTVPLIGRFQLLNNYWTSRGSYLDWVGVYPATIDDCTSPFRWLWIATCAEQVVQGQKYIVCEFVPLPEGNYRLGYFSHYSNCLIGLSKSFRVVEQPPE